MSHDQAKQNHMVPGCFCFCYNMAFQMRCVARKGTAIFLFSLFSCLLGVGEGRYNAFRKFRVEQAGSRGAEEQWFTQKLDHFNGADGREWKQVSRGTGYAQASLK